MYLLVRSAIAGFILVASPLVAPLQAQEGHETRHPGLDSESIPAPHPLLDSVDLGSLDTASLYPASTIALWAGFSDTVAPPQVEPGRDRIRGALWGGGIGFVAGGLLGVLSVESDDGAEGTLVESAATGTAFILGAVVGGGIGALLGATWFAPSERIDSDAGGGLGFSLSPSASSEGWGADLRMQLRR